MFPGKAYPSHAILHPPRIPESCHVSRSYVNLSPSPPADFVVGVWGKDFVPEVHEEVVRAAAVAGYLPTVDVFLPVCGEDIALLRNTWRNVAAMDYPSFEVHVLDDGAKDAVRDLAETFGFRCKTVGGHVRCGKGEECVLS